MKRSVLNLFICLVLVFGVHASAFATITITAPSSTTTLTIGVNTTVYFTYTNYSPNFRGEFWKDGTTLIGTSFQVYNTATVSTSSLIPGSYKMKIYNGYNTSDYGWSDTFTVIAYPAPTGFYTNAITSTNFLLAWGAVSGATSYRVDVSTSISFSSFVLNNATFTGNNYNPITGLTPGVTYYCRVRAVGPNGTSANSSTYAVATTPDAPVANAATSITYNSFVASWGAVTHADHYLLYVATNSGFTSMVSGYNGLSVSGTSYTVTGLTPNTAYYYKLQTINGTGGASGYSNAPSTGTVPETPTGFYTNVIASTSFLIAWGAVSGATSYRLDVSTSSSFSTFIVNNASFTSNNYNPVTGLTPGVTYYCRVRAVGPYGTSPNSGTYAVATIPDAPVATAATSITLNSFVANWNAVSGITNYLLYVATDSGFTNMVSGYGGITVTGTSHSITGLTANTLYYYKLQSLNGTGGASGYSNPISAVTLPTAPTGFYTNVIANTSFLIAWGAVPNATSYRLDVSLSSSFSTFVVNNATVTGNNYNPVTGLTPGTIYYVRVRTVNASGTSGNSSTYPVTTLLDGPTATAATNVTYYSFTANWTSSTNATSYLLDVATNGSFTNFVPGYHNFSLTATTINIKGLSQTTNYYYRVRATNSAQTSGYSNTISTTTLVDPNNWVKEEVAHVGTLTASTFAGGTLLEKETNTQFFDGLGRLVQTVNVDGSPTQNDLVTVQEYDVFGRQVKNYLPYIVNPGDGLFQSSATTAQASYYSTTHGTYNNKVATDDAPYSVKVFEASPLNRILQQGAPGTAWQPNAASPSTANSAQTNYYVNVDGTSAGQETIYIWTVTLGSTIEQAYAVTSNTAKYPLNALTIVETKDEDKRTVRTYYDNRGLMILKKVQAVATPQINVETDWAYTYYVYDLFDRLRFVLQPEFYQDISTYIGYCSVNNLTAMANVLEDGAFQYTYDMRGRMICKNIPGAKRVDMVYDDWNRLVLTQDGVERAANKWAFNKYDEFNRTIMAGEYSSTNVRSAMATAVAASTGRYENAQSGSIGYTVGGSYPTTVTISDINTISFYDDYSFKSSLSLGTGYDYNPTASTYTRVKNLLTGSKTRVMGTSSWLVAANYFDDRHRPTQTVSDDYLSNKNRTTNVYYGITPQLTSTTTNHGSVLTKLDETEYDHRGRTTKTYTTMDGGTRIMTSAMTYNEMGQLVDKGVHSTDAGTTFLQSIDYRYNIRGWNTHINNSSISNDGTTNDDTNDLFGMELKYNQAIAINGVNTTSQFGGNVASMQWSTNNMHDPVVERIYGFAYDPMNRLKDATYAKNSSSSFSADVDLYNENLTYDKNGNIITLNRNGLLGTANVQIDQLHYTYAGNQLSYVDDNSPYHSDDSENPAYGFMEDVQMGSAEYAYNDNGAVTSDANKQITSITYNSLNLPVLITMNGGRTIEYTWAATGEKLKKIVKIGSNTVGQSDYVNGIQYENTALSFITTNNGRIIKTGTGWDYEYFMKDHLGNTRAAYGVMKIANTYTATMEDATASQEAQDFKNISETRNSAFNHTPTSSLYPTPINSSLTRSIQPVGPSKMLAVQQHDAVTLTAYARFSTGIGGNNTLIGNVANAITSAYGLTNVGEAAQAFTALQGAIPGYSATVSNSSSTVPKAYLAYVLFNSSYASPQFGFQQISTAANGAWETLTITIADVPTSGYLYAYVINESAVADVYFDDVSIQHTRNNAGLLVTQTNDYYPFGMAISPLSYQNQATNRNDYKYGGKELQDEFGLNWQDFDARMYMSDIARWGVPDPLADKARRWTPYRYGFNNPMRFIDPDGMFEYSNGYQTLNSDNESGAVAHEGSFSMPENKNGAAADESAGSPTGTPPVAGTTLDNGAPSDTEPEKECYSCFVADILRNMPFFGLNAPNPFYNAEAIYADGGWTLVGAEGDKGGFFILVGKDKGTFVPFKEVAGGGAPEAGVGIEIGRVDISGNPYDFDRNYLFGLRDKVWLSAGEGISVGGAFSWSSFNGTNVYATSVQAGVGFAAWFVSGGYNHGRIDENK